MAKILYKKGMEGQNKLSSIEGIEDLIKEGYFNKEYLV